MASKRKLIEKMRNRDKEVERNVYYGSGNGDNYDYDNMTCISLSYNNYIETTKVKYIDADHPLKADITRVLEQKDYADVDDAVKQVLKREYAQDLMIGTPLR